MSPDAIYARTPAGQREIGHAQCGIDRRHRMLLSLVDGHKTAGELLRLASQFHAGGKALRKLEALGLVRLIGIAGAAGSSGEPAYRPARDVTYIPHRTKRVRTAIRSRYSQARDYMRRIISNAFGERASFFTRMVDQCSTLGELRALLGTFEAVLRVIYGKSFAANARVSAERLLST